MSTDPPAAVGRCLACDYPLRDLTTPRCPECGRAFDATDPSTMNLSGRSLVRGLTRWLLKPVGWWTVAAALLLTTGLYWFTWVPLVGAEAREYLRGPEWWPFLSAGDGWTPSVIWPKCKEWWAEGFKYHAARNACVIAWAAGLLTLWVLVRAVLALAVACRRRNFRDVLHAQWRRWACLAVLAGLFWAGLRYDAAFRLVAWGHGPAFDRLVADMKRGPLLFRYPDRRVGWFDVTDIYVKGDTVGFRTLVDVGDWAYQVTDPAARTPVWIRIRTSGTPDGPPCAPDDDDDRPIDLDWCGTGRYESMFPLSQKRGTPDFAFHAGKVSLAQGWSGDADRPSRAQLDLAYWLGDRQDPDPRTVRSVALALADSPVLQGPNGLRERPVVYGLRADSEYTEPEPDDPSPLPVSSLPVWERWDYAYPRPDVEALVDLGAKAVPALIEALDPARPTGASDAAWILGRMGPKAAAAEGRLAALLSHPDLRLAQDAMIALTRLETVTAASVPALMQAADSPDPALRQAAMQNLRFAQVDAGVLLPVFRKGLVHPDRNVRLRAAAGLWQLGPKAADAVPDLHAALLAVDAAAATQPDRSSTTLAMDEALRIVYACALARAKPDDGIGRAALARAARDVLARLADPTVRRPGRSESADPKPELSLLPILAAVVLQGTVEDRRAWAYESYLWLVLEGCERDGSAVDVRDLRIAVAAWRRALRPDGETRQAYAVACAEAAQTLAQHRQAAYRDVVPLLPPAVPSADGDASTWGVVEMRRRADLQRLTLDVVDNSLERSVDERIVAAEALFALARTRDELGAAAGPISRGKGRSMVGDPHAVDVAHFRAETRLGQAIWAAMRRFDPAWADLEWNVAAPVLRVEWRDVKMSLRRQGLARLAASAARKDAVGEAARKALRELLDSLAYSDTYFYPELLAAQIRLDPAVARAHWQKRGRSALRGQSSLEPLAGTRLVRVLADAGWLPAAEAARLEARMAAHPAYWQGLSADCRAAILAAVPPEP